MKKIAVVGMGVMGSAIAQRLEHHFEVIGVGRGESLQAVAEADALILAVKPQSFKELADELWLTVNKQLVVSVMAGITTARLCRTLGTELVVRTMPNRALAAGQSLTGWYTKNPSVDTGLLQALLDTWGASMRLQREGQFDAFTAIAGSGPAYFYYLARALQNIAPRYGFDTNESRQLAAYTMIGAASLVTPETSFDEQIARVASKGGTTQAALGVFDDVGLEHSIGEAVKAACERSQQLGNS